MTALADHLTARPDRGSRRGPGGAGPGPATASGPAVAADRSGTVRDQARTVRSWPLLLLAFPAAAEVWSGWVGIAQKTGFGLVSPLPGIWPSLHLDTTITLPIGVEAYAAYALRAWLDSSPDISQRTRRFAKWSAISSFALGMAGQVAYHLLAQAGTARAPWIITTIVSCLPVLVLAMGTTLAHMLRADVQDSADRGPAGSPPADQAAGDQGGPGQDQERHRGGEPGLRTRTPKPDCSPSARTAVPGARGAHPHEDHARLIARHLATAGGTVSRRALRDAGARGSNESLNAIARQINAEPTEADGRQRAPALRGRADKPRPLAAPGGPAPT